MERVMINCAIHEPIVEGAPWAVIAVMGVTGSGKSTFIRTVTGDQSVVVGDGMESCTSGLQGYTFHYNGYNINLVDSPGFNDTFRSETDVLQDIATWLRESYGGVSRQQLTGIVYLHGINHVRMEGSALRNLRVFRELCGPEPLKNVILATTFWDHVHPTVGQAREAELSTRSEFWGAMVKRGSRIARFDGLASGLGIISGLLDLEPQPLKIQRELVDDDISLVNTSAGQVVNEELEKLEHEHRMEKQKMQKELAEALERRDIELQEIIQAEHERVEAELSKVQRQQAQLKADRRAEHRRMQNEFERQMWEMENQNCTLERRLTKHDEDRQREKEEDHQRISRLEYELAKYNDAATRRWDGLEIDQIIAQIRVEESKLRAEDREKLEAEIQKLRLKATTDAQAFRPPPPSGMPQAKFSRWNGAAKKAGAIFVAGLKIALPITTLFTIGMPIGLSNSGSGLSTLTDIFGGGGDAGAA